MKYAASTCLDTSESCLRCQAVPRIICRTSMDGILRVLRLTRERGFLMALQMLAYPPPPADSRVRPIRMYC